MFRDIRDGEAVFVRRPDAHPHPVYLYGQRTMEIHGEPVPIRWNGYYHSLRAEGAIEEVTAGDVRAAAAKLDEQLESLDIKALDAWCEEIGAAAAADSARMASYGAGQAAANASAGARARVAALRKRWEELQAPPAAEDKR